MKFFIKFLMILLSFVAQMQLHNGGGGKLCCCFERFETTTKKFEFQILQYYFIFLEFLERIIKLIFFLTFFGIFSDYFRIVSSQQVLANLCDQPGGDWCSMRCQILGGRDGRCDKVKMCNCRPL